jgi:hypothetical protein
VNSKVLLNEPSPLNAIEIICITAAINNHAINHPTKEDTAVIIIIDIIPYISAGNILNIIDVV